ncbi:MAG: sulfite exporter TauE/SafE family protein [Methanotrichaceae archaeon]|nr:sulfite exporter TauE/SafE family protein [Methanotrichaceae archaeon]
MLDPFAVYVIVLLAAGAAVGFVSGLLGVGGGFIMVPVQIWALTFMGIEETLAVRIAIGTSLAVILPTALSGCQGHSCRGVVRWRQGIALGISGLAGAFLGGGIAAQLPGDLLKFIFGLVVLASAAIMLAFRGKTILFSENQRGIFYFAASGFLVGIISGLTGIGGGVILIPILVLGLGFGMLEAVGTSSLAIAFNAAGGAFSYAVNGIGVPGRPPYSIGYIDLLQFTLLATTSILMARAGVRAAHRLPGEKLKYLFIVLMIYIGLRMIGVFGWLGLPI